MLLKLYIDSLLMLAHFGSSAELENPLISQDTLPPHFGHKERFQINRAWQDANALTSHRRPRTGRRPGCHRFSFYVKFWNSSGFPLRCKNQSAKMRASLVSESNFSTPFLPRNCDFRIRQVEKRVRLLCLLNYLTNLASQKRLKMSSKVMQWENGFIFLFR